MTYHLVKEPGSEKLIESWIPFKEREYEDMEFRQNQLQIRVRECQRALDLLFQLNSGSKIDDVLYSTIDLSNFKVIIAITY